MDYLLQIGTKRSSFWGSQWGRLSFLACANSLTLNFLAAGVGSFESHPRRQLPAAIGEPAKPVLVRSSSGGGIRGARSASALHLPKAANPTPSAMLRRSETKAGACPP